MYIILRRIEGYLDLINVIYFIGVTVYLSYKEDWITCAQCLMTLFILKTYTDMPMISQGYCISLINGKREI